MIPKIPIRRRFVRRRHSIKPYVMAAILALAGIMAVVLIAIALMQRSDPVQQICICNNGISCAGTNPANGACSRNSWHGARSVPEPGTLPLALAGIAAIALINKMGKSWQ